MKSKKIKRSNKSKKVVKKVIKKALNKSKKVIKKGGKLSKKCVLDESNFPICGEEGCVYLENENAVTKKQWKTNQQIFNHLTNIKGQKESVPFSPSIISENIKPCDLISKIGSENKAPCFVKRVRTTKQGKKILYEEENRDSWCRNYGIKNNCVVDDLMYDKFKSSVPKIVLNQIPERLIGLPDVDIFSDGDVDSIEDEELGDLHNNVDISDNFTNLNPIFITDITMNRIKGITIFELINETYEKLGDELTKSISKNWEDEMNELIEKIKEIGYTSKDFNEQNIMIDVDNDMLCSWIDDKLENGIPVTPQMIKEEFGKENILKIVDWGLLNEV